MTDHQSHRLPTIVLLMFLPWSSCLSQSASQKTLRDQVHEKGSAHGWVFSNKIVTGPYGFQQVVEESSLIVEAQIVAIDAHLTKDEQSVVTDYSLQVYQVLKDPNQLIKTTGPLTITAGGGQTMVDGGKVEVESNIAPLCKGDMYVLFLNQQPGGSALSLLSEYGVFKVDKDVVECDKGRQLLDMPCNKKLSEFYESLTKILSAPKTAVK
jgi:hypothetical protein